MVQTQIMQKFIAILMMPGYDSDATYDDSNIPIAISSDGNVIVIRAPDNDRNMISDHIKVSLNINVAWV